MNAISVSFFAEVSVRSPGNFLFSLSLKKSGSKYPRNIKFNLKNRSTHRGAGWINWYAVQAIVETNVSALKAMHLIFIIEVNIVAIL